MIIQFAQDTIEKSAKPIVVSAFASWCPHCARMKPILEEIEKEFGHKYTFTEFDIDESPKFTSQFEIHSIPTFIFIKDKQEVDRTMGEMSKEELIALIEKYLG